MQVKNNQRATKKKGENHPFDEFVHFEFKYILLTSSKKSAAGAVTWWCGECPPGCHF